MFLLTTFYMNRGSLKKKKKKYFFKSDRNGYLTFQIIYCLTYDLKTLMTHLSLGETTLTVTVTKYKKTTFCLQINIKSEI